MGSYYFYTGISLYVFTSFVLIDILGFQPLLRLQVFVYLLFNTIYTYLFILYKVAVFSYFMTMYNVESTRRFCNIHFPESVLSNVYDTQEIYRYCPFRYLCLSSNLH